MSEECPKNGTAGCLACWINDMVGEVGDAPFYDDLEFVVRCKDCKHYIAPSVFDKKSYCGVMAGLEGPKSDSFCSYGELREDKKMEE